MNDSVSQFRRHAIFQRQIRYKSEQNHKTHDNEELVVGFGAGHPHILHYQFRMSIVAVYLHTLHWFPVVEKRAGESH